MPIALKDIPRGQLTPDEIEALANGTFDYADRERVSLREAERAMKEQAHSESIQYGIAKVGKFYYQLPVGEPLPGGGYSFERSSGPLTFKDKTIELAKATHRGIGAVVKVPGIALKGIGEMALTRKEIAELEESPYAFQRLRAKTMQNPVGRGMRYTADLLRKAGNKYINTVNEMMENTQESPESRAVRTDLPFSSAPVYKSAMAVGESAPAYGTAIATALATGSPNMGLLAIGTSASASAYDSYRQQNIDPDLALIGAAVEGSIEVLTEKVPMDILMKGAGRPFVIRALKLGTAESFQELLAQLGQNYTAAVVQDVDPDNYHTALQAAKQEWDIISQGWQDAMAAGFIMGGGAAVFAPGQIEGLKTAKELRTEYGFVPRTTPELLSLTEQVKEKVRQVEKRAEPIPEGVTEEAEKPPQVEQVGPPERVYEPILEIGEGEEKPRGTSVSVMAQAIEDELVAESKLEELPTYRAMNMREQAQKMVNHIERDIEQVKRWAFYKESPPPDIFPENAFTALRIYAKMNLDLDLIMDLALNEDTVREHTILGKRIKSLDTDNDYADPVKAVREIAEARIAQKVRSGEMEALETKLQELKAELERTKKANTNFVQRAERSYGRRNKLVTKDEYNSIIARRDKEAAELIHAGRSMGAAYVPNAQDFVDIGKIGLFHLEAMGRDFAKWAYQMTKDFGQWITPYLKDEYEKAISEAAKQGVEIKESKRLRAKKKRLVTTTKKIKGKLETLELEKTRRIPIELDEEAQKLQDKYDRAKAEYRAAQDVANIITKKEVEVITRLSKDVAERKIKMEKSPRRDNSKGEGPKVEEYEYGIAAALFMEYVGDLKLEAIKKTTKEAIKAYLENPADFISDFAGTLKAAKASLDISFALRQGLPTFLKGITGDVASMKIWWNTFVKSKKALWKGLKKQPAMRGLFAEIISDPDYELLKQSKVALNVIEEEIPVDIPSKIPLIGRLFRAGENDFVWSSRYMRYQIAKQYINIWRKSGRELSKRELESIGRLANSQTGRGDIGSRSQRPGFINNVFWSPRNLRAYIDILTVHAFDRNISSFARRQAAINLLRYISGAAMILAIADWIDDDSVTKDSNSADFGKIKIGNTRFAVGGGPAVLVVLASRLITRKYTSSTTGKTVSIDEKKWGALGGKDLIFNFLENKLSPAAQLALSVIDQKTRDGKKLVIPQMVNNALTPLIIQNVFEVGSVDDSANVLAALIAEALGVNVQTYSSQKQKRKRRL